jgi:hypothetical protein
VINRVIVTVGLAWVVLTILACDQQGNLAGTDGSVSGEVGADSIGVAECDEYVSAFKICLSRVPADGKTAFENAGNAQIAGFRKTAKDPATLEAARTACARALGALRRNPACK